MGNNPQKSARLQQISRYEVKASDEEQSEKHLVTANQFYFWEEYDRAKEFYLQSLRYNHKNIKSLANLALVYKKQRKIYDAYICLLNKTYIESGYEDYIEEKIVNKQSAPQGTSTAVFLPTEHNCDDQAELSSKVQALQLDLAKRYFLSNKALMDILPLMKEDLLILIQQMKLSNKKFELMFFIEQLNDKFGELSEQDTAILCEIYKDYNLNNKILNINLNLLKQQPNNQFAISAIIHCYKSMENEQKVQEYTQMLSNNNS